MFVNSETYDINGHKLVLRNVFKDEAKEVLDVFKKISDETPFLMKGSDEIYFDEKGEELFLDTINCHQEALFLGAFYDDHYIGNVTLTSFDQYRFRHRMELGIALLQDYTHMGIGTLLMKKAIKHALELHKEQIELEVMSKNIHAINLYKKCGFIQTGIKVNNMKYKDNTYDDAIIMVKTLKEDL